MFTLGGGTIIWRSARQTIITRSTMKSKFVTLEIADSEAKWLKNMLITKIIYTNDIIIKYDTIFYN